MGRNGIFFRLSRSARIEICLRTGNTVSHVFLSFFCSAFFILFYFLPEPQHTEQIRHRHAGIGKLRKIPDRFRHADAPGKRCKAEENTVNHSEAILFHQPEKRLLPLVCPAGHRCKCELPSPLHPLFPPPVSPLPSRSLQRQGRSQDRSPWYQRTHLSC